MRRLFKPTTAAHTWRLVASRTIAVLPVLLVIGTGSAQASCTYNVGSNASYQSIEFRSHFLYSGGYASWNLGPGQSQCWYAHGWDDGWFGPADEWLETSWPSLINVDAHGWIDICLWQTSESQVWTYDVFGGNGQLQNHQQGVIGGYRNYPPGCKGPLGSARAPRPGHASTGRLPGPSPSTAEAVFATEGAVGRSTRSITFHLYNAKRTPIGSACVPPRDVSHMTLDLARTDGVAAVYVGASESTRECGDAALAGRERAGRPLADRRFVTFCEPTKGRGTFVYRYPSDFTRRVGPACKSG